ncbi:MAG: porin [Thiotrichaceae bacterium]
MNTKLTTAIGGSLLMIFGSQTLAVDWPSLQGLEGKKKEKAMRIWGFLEPEYARTDGTDLQAGPWAGQEAVFNQIGPDNTTSDTFDIRRARVGIRGQFDFNRVNYFFLSEFGNNGITRKDGAQLTDASVTLNYIPGAHIRIGQFKTPQGNEAQKAIHTFDWNNFTNAANQLLLERFTEEDGSRPGFANGLNGPIGAFRDIGIQAHNTFKRGDRELTYAVMLGNGNGINRSDNDDNKELYLLLSTEKVFGGRGPRRQGFKTYAWYIDGKRTLNFANGVAGEQEFDRTRWGLGTTYRKGKYRVAAEYVKAEGMIFNGSDGGAIPGAVATVGPNAGAVSSLNYLTDNEADGWHLDVGYKVLPKLELAIRYDELNRGTEGAAGNERHFETLGLSAQYFFSPRTRVIANYDFRDADAPGLPSGAVPNQILDGLDDKLTLQVLHVF